MQLAAQEVNAAGGIMGRKVNVIPVDAPDPVDTVPAIRKMLAVDNVSMVVGPDVNSYQNALPIFEQQKMVNFTYIGTPGVYTSRKWVYSFRTAPSDAFVGATMVEYAHEKGYKNVAVVLDAEEGSQSLLPSLTSAARTLGINIVAQPSIPTSVPSYAGYVSQIVNAHPDAMLFQMSTAAASGAFFKQFQQLAGSAVSMPIIGSDFTANADVVNAMGASYAASHLTSIIPSLGANDAAGQAFLAAYQAKFNTAPKLYAPHFFDGFIVGCLAMVKAGSTDPSVYVNSILDVTSTAAGHQVVYNFADGVAAIKAGKEIKYSGAGGPMTYNSIHTVTGPFQAVSTDSQGNETVIANISADALAPFTKGTD
jgi:ABC-type branched-subunit amino acid transport system substrate-binding protein